jgi:F1F0 ATPase subunit 2
MDSPAVLILALIAGAMLGAIFFGGLWLTARAIIASRRSALWVPFSLPLRMGFALLGFYAIGGDDWKRWLSCVAGFFLARLAASWMSAEPSPDVAHPLRKGGHAP